jgi:glutathione S-transferase
MIRLHYAPSSASMIPHILLEEIGVAYERVLVNTGEQAHRDPAYLRLNPNGHVPVLTDTDSDMVLYETAAIALYLCDAHPHEALAPVLGTTERAQFYKWMMWLTNTLQAALIIYFYAHRWMDAGNDAGVAELKRNAEERIDSMLSQLDAEVARTGGPWFMGAEYTALDAYVFTLCRWTRNFDRTTPARDRRFLGSYLLRMLGRTSVQRVLANEGLSSPYI